MFMLSRYLVKNDYAAFIAGLIFAFSPMHIAQSYGHLDWTIIEFMPLFILFFMLIIREKKPIYALGGAVSFILLAFMGDIEQGIMAVVFVVASLIILVAYELLTKHYSVLSRRVYLALAIMAVLVLVLGAPFFIPIFKGITPTVLNETNLLSGQVQNMLWSNNLASFFLPSYYNGIFHSASLSYYNSTYGLNYGGVQYQADVTERVSYIGYSVLLLVLIALYYDMKSHFRSTRFWLAIFLVFGWLSLGPLLQVSSTVTSVPTLYSAYRLIPYFNILREPGRFDMIATIALAILAAVGFSELMKKHHERKGAMLVAAIIFSVLILVEYNGMPMSPQYANQSYMTLHMPSAYKELANVSSNYTMLILPALPNATAPNLYPGMSMYYQTAFKKPMVGGYTSRENETQLLSVRSIPLAVSAGYLESGQGLAYPSPIIENFTNVTLFWLGYYNIGFVGVIRQAYNATEQGSLLSYLYSALGAPVYQSNTTVVFSTSTALQKNFGKSVVAYPAGTWLPGFAICAAPHCNATVEDAWWGSGYRGITIFSPNATNATIAFSALSYYMPMHVSTYANSASGFIATLNVTQSPAKYSFAMQLNRGFNELFLISENLSTTNPNVDPYLTYGIYNLTVGKSLKLLR